uniref:Protein EFR3 homolog A n=1 Tax=Callorhinchus milii TaxID=7868 RepID=A0A4W3J4Z1_CALMI
MRRYNRVPRAEPEQLYRFNIGSEPRPLLSCGVCGCCGALRPRYKRLVDNIFPEDPKDGLVKADMEKLTFYAVSAPDKLDRIGKYLAERLSRDVVRHRCGYVFIAMEALDQLLMACHSQSINLFVESFLQMVAKLLESGEPELQILGSNSFVKFANIEEDTASYHRRYDFFVSRFSAMCHSCIDDMETRTKIRIAGIKGIQGVVRKTVNDELQTIIWEPQHMDKIVPSLLFNMQKTEESDRSESADKDENPAALAESCFRELLGRAAYGNMNNAVRPVLVHLDNHQLWEPNEFAVSCFKITMYSIQAQHSHHVIQQILRHLDNHNKDSPRVRAGIVQVLLETVAIAAKGSVGPTVLEVFNTLLKHLRLSVDFELSNKRSSTGTLTNHDEKVVQDTIIKTIGFFGSNLPDYQRSEIIMFIMGKVPVYDGTSHTLDTSQSGEQATRRIQVMLLRSLFMVTSGYKAKSIAAALPAPFLEPLLSVSLMEDSELRQLVLQILHSLIDRHDNKAKFKGMRIIPDVSTLKIKREKSSKQDISFMKKQGQQLYRYIYLGCKEEDNDLKNFDSLFIALALITIELANDEVIIDLVRLALAMQDVAVSNEDNLPMYNRCAILALVAGYLNFLSQMIAIPAFCQHVNKPFYGKFFSINRLPKSLESQEKSCFFLQTEIADTLASSGYSVEKLSVPYVPQVTGMSGIFNLILFALPIKADNQNLEEQEKEKRRQVIEKFQKAPFEEIAAQCESKSNLLHDKLAQIFELTIRPPPSPSGSVNVAGGHVQYHSIPVYEMKFPDLCVY